MLPNCCFQLGIERRQLRSVRALGMQLKLRMLDYVSDACCLCYGVHGAYGVASASLGSSA